MSPLIAPINHSHFLVYIVIFLFIYIYTERPDRLDDISNGFRAGRLGFGLQWRQERFYLLHSLQTLRTN
jgi:hypothetical protein